MFRNWQNELRLAALFVWLIVSIGTFILLLLPFLVPQHLLAQYIPECEWQTQFHKPCVFCGMSTAFYAISRGDFIGAYRLNPLSLYIYAVFVLNMFCAALTLKHTTHFIKRLGPTLRSDNALS